MIKCSVCGYDTDKDPCKKCISDEINVQSIADSACDSCVEMLGDIDCEHCEKYHSRV